MAGDARGRKIQIVLGAGETGKSSAARYLALEYLTANPGAELIIGDPARNWAKVGLGEWSPSLMKSRKAREEWIATITNHGRGPAMGSRVGMPGALLVLDDADMMHIPKNGMETNFNALWMIWRHLRLDILLISHRPQGIPLEAFAACKMIMCFALEEKNAQEYLQETSVGDYAWKLPQRRGVALVVRKEPLRYQYVDTFKSLPKPAIVDRRLIEAVKRSHDYKQQQAKRHPGWKWAPESGSGGVVPL